VPDDFQRAAVLIAFWAEDADVRCVLTRRSNRVSSHKGQVAFPGGRLDPGESWRDAALREAEEEVGLPPRAVEVIGELDDAWSGAGHHIVPVVAWLASAPRLTASPAEVSEILLPRLSELTAPDALRVEEVTHQGRIYENHILDWPGGSVYGLSTDLLLEALAWGRGDRPERGPERLRDLREYHGPRYSG
jgi:8-oxo-dGTP pyrophosphatase MutT (NUDIX family)